MKVKKKFLDPSQMNMEGGLIYNFALYITDLVLKIAASTIGFNLQNAIGRVREDIQTIDAAFLKANVGSIHDEVVTSQMLRGEGEVAYAEVS